MTLVSPGQFSECPKSQCRPAHLPNIQPRIKMSRYIDLFPSGSHCNIGVTTDFHYHQFGQGRFYESLLNRTLIQLSMPAFYRPTVTSYSSG